MVEFLVQMIQLRPAHLLRIFDIQLFLSHHLYLIHQNLDRPCILPVPDQTEKEHGKRGNSTQKKTCFLNSSGFPKIFILGNHIYQFPVMIREIIFDVLFLFFGLINGFQILGIRRGNDLAVFVHQRRPAAIIGNHAITLADLFFIQGHTEIAVLLRFFRLSQSHNPQKNRSVDHTVKGLCHSHIQTLSGYPFYKRIAFLTFFQNVSRLFVYFHDTGTALFFRRRNHITAVAAQNSKTINIRIRIHHLIEFLDNGLHRHRPLNGSLIGVCRIFPGQFTISKLGQIKKRKFSFF